MTPCPKAARWTKRDYKFLALAMLIKFGDAVEMYMPGVITQKVSCELDVSFFPGGDSFYHLLYLHGYSSTSCCTVN